MAEQKKPTPKYQNNSLAGVVKNQRESTKSDWRDAGQEIKDFGKDVNDRLTRQGYATLKAGNDVINAAKKAYNFVTSPAQEVETNEQRLQRYLGQGYTTKKGSDFLYGPDGKVSNIKYDGSIGQLGKTASGLTANVKNLTPIGQSTETGHSPTTFTPTPSQGTSVQTTTNNAPHNGAITYSNYPSQGDQNNQNGFQLKNADVNISQYGDDSSAKNYNNPALWGGENQKYSGEETKNSQVAYDPNATIEGLDPNYKYGWDAQVANSNEMNYIAKRNDQIASALYNAGLTSIEDVANFLNTQQGFMNSNENERQNTINAIWKRIGQIQPQGQQQVDQQTTPGNPQSPGASITDEQAKNGVIYGRASGNENTRIETNADAFSPDAIQLRQRQANLTTLNSMDSYDIALTLNSGASIFGETAMRDLMTYNPQKYQEIQQYQKQLNGMDNVNSIASGGKSDILGQTQNATDVINNGIDSWIKQNSTERSYDTVKDILTSKLANSQTAQTATQEMLNLNSQIADLQEELDNLPKTAQKQFKGDVPQYIVDAYVSNNSQRIQSQLNKLQSRYNAAIDLYKTEVSQQQWAAEMELKNRQLELQANQQAWNQAFQTQQQAWTQYYQNENLKLNRIKTDSKGRPYVVNGNGTMTYLDDNTYDMAVQQQVQAGVDSLMTAWQDGMRGGQCEAFTDNWTNDVYGQTMVGIDAQGNPTGVTATTAREKAQYANTAVPKAGTVAIFNYGENSSVSDAAKQWGHTMVVTGYDPDTQMITLKGSNGPKGDEKVYSTSMSVQDFYSSRGGVGFWDPSKPTWWQSQNQQVAPQSVQLDSMNDLYGQLISGTETQGKLDTLATAQTMYNILAEIRDNGSLEHLVESGDLQKVLAGINEKKFTEGDAGSEFSKQLRAAISKKGVDTQSQIALNKLLYLVEKKLRKESGAAISSSEWMSNFEMMLPRAYEDIDLMRAKLTNWDNTIRTYSMAGGMTWKEYQPLFNDEWMARETR